MDSPHDTILSYCDFSVINSESITNILESEYESISYPISPPAEHLLQLQTPTPVESHSPSPVVPDPASEEIKNTTVSISTAFHPGAHIIETDITFLSSDKVLFYVHSQVLSGISPNALRRVIEAHRDSGKITSADNRDSGSQDDTLIHIPDTSFVLDIILHLLYGISPAHHSPSFETLVTAVDRMPFYDILPQHHIIPRTPLYDLLLTHAPLFPMDLYSLAGHHNLQDLAVATSSHLLSYTLLNISDEEAARMGALYLKRLFCLHLVRSNALKEILLSPPHPHPATKECSFVDQKSLTRAWALVAAYLAWDVRPDLSTHSIRNSFQPLVGNLTCEICREGLQKRVKDIVVRWASMKRTI